VALLADDPEVARIVTRHLQRCRVLPVATALEARALARAEVLHAVVAVRSSAHGAEGALAELMQIQPGLPVVLCAVAREAGASPNSGAAAHLVKPVMREKLLAVLQQINPNARDIVVADDDPEMVRLLRRMLRSASRRYRVYPAYDGLEALALMRARRPDVVLLDILMPNMDGRRVVDEMRSSDDLKDVPVVIVTAREGETEAVTGELLAFARGDGMPVIELLVHLNSTLDALTRPPSREGATPNSARSHPGAPVG
jgi:CheY-like chemotaxis protein